MGVENEYEFLGEYAAKLIRKKARQLVGRYGFAELDIKDLEQELAIDLHLRLLKFDPVKASHCLVSEEVGQKQALS